MIKSIKVINPSGESLKMELGKPEQSGFLIEHIDGLGPVKATMNTSKLANYHGVIYNSSYLGSRNINITLRFMESVKESIEDVRHKSYKYFPINQQIRLIIETDTRTVETTGIVEDNPVDIFNRIEKTVIPILCPDPFLYSVSDSITTFTGISPKFKFPFSNKTTEPELHFGDIDTRHEANVFYKGDYETGCTITINALDDLEGNVEIHNLTDSIFMKLDTAKIPNGILTGDTITIETSPKHKSIMLLRDGKKINILNALAKNTKWFVLRKGNNLFAYRTEVEADINKLYFDIKNKVVYEGV